ncbi:RHS repeat-associated core domain-containing protein, partial [Enterobacter vonholyi]
NGTPERMTDIEGQVRWEGVNSAWGKLLRESESQVSGYSQNLRMQGQYLDRETGLHYNLFRYYDPDCGRFTQQDPIGLAGGINLYQYAPNALGWVDPWGLKPRCAPTKANDHNQAAFGRQWQGHGEYKGRDLWSNTMLKEGDVIYGGAPGQSGFYFDKATLDAAGGSRQKLWESLQVQPHRIFGFRSKIQAYRVKRDAVAGTGQALSQDPVVFGQGGGTQFFLSNYKTVLEPIGKPFDIGM